MGTRADGRISIDYPFRSFRSVSISLKLGHRSDPSGKSCHNHACVHWRDSNLRVNPVGKCLAQDFRLVNGVTVNKGNNVLYQFSVSDRNSWLARKRIRPTTGEWVNCIGGRAWIVELQRTSIEAQSD
jgi:hypothetical protein